MKDSNRQLPLGWSRVRLQDIIEMADAGIWGESDPNHGISILRSTNFKNDGTFDLSNLTLRAISPEKRSPKSLIPGDILLERSGGGPLQPVGRVCLFEGDKNEHSFSNFCQRFRARKGICDAEFLFWNLFLFHLSGQTQLYQKQTTGIRNLEYRRYLLHEILLPPLSTQKCIAGLLRERMATVERARAAARARLEAVKALQAAFLREEFSPGRLSQWTIGTINDLATLVVDGPHVTPSYVPEGVPFVTVRNIQTGVLDFRNLSFITEDDHKEFSRRGKAEKGDILYTKDGTLGIPCVVDTDRPFSFFVSVALIKLKREIIDSHYVAYAMKSQFLLNQVKHLCAGAGLKHMVLKSIRALRIPLPDLGVQRRIMESLRGKMKEVEKGRIAAETELKTINALPIALIRTALNGDL
jgi:type I restriction enzyme, S subunit